MHTDLRKRALKLRYYPDELLRKISELGITFNLDMQDFVDSMIVFMREYGGIGLAAPQVGVLQRIVVADFGGEPHCIVNPEISEASGSGSMQEGCLSLPGIEVDIKRNSMIEIKGRDIRGKPVSYEARGLSARILQHEVDHLNGILIIDYDKNRNAGFDIV